MAFYQGTRTSIFGKKMDVFFIRQGGFFDISFGSRAYLVSYFLECPSEREIMSCEYLDRCSFFGKFGRRQSNVWKGLVNFYCKGSGFSVCAGHKKVLEEKNFLDENLMPTGNAIPKAFFDLP